MTASWGFLWLITVFIIFTEAAGCAEFIIAPDYETFAEEGKSVLLKWEFHSASTPVYMKWFKTNSQNAVIKNIIIINNRGESIVTGIEICVYQKLEIFAKINLLNSFHAADFLLNTKKLLFFMLSGGIETQPAFTCSELPIETLEQSVKYIQS